MAVIKEHLDLETKILQTSVERYGFAVAVCLFHELKLLGLQKAAVCGESFPARVHGKVVLCLFFEFDRVDKLASNDCTQWIVVTLVNRCSRSIK